MPFGTDLFSFRRNISSAKHISSNFNCISSLQGKHIENPKDLYPVLSTKQKRDEINRLFNAFIGLNIKFFCLIQQHNRTVPLSLLVNKIVPKNVRPQMVLNFLSCVNTIEPSPCVLLSEIKCTNRPLVLLSYRIYGHIYPSALPLLDHTVHSQSTYFQLLSCFEKINMLPIE